MNIIPPRFDPDRFAAAADQLAVAAADFAARGWTPATAGNFSLRLDSEHAVISASGRDKGRLTRADFLVIDSEGRVVGSASRPSAETRLHTQLYRWFPEAGCVLHTHSRAQTVASRLFAEARILRLQGYELLKAFRGNGTHETALEVPVLPNSQDMEELAAGLAPYLEKRAPLFGYLIAGHGLYAWGADIVEASRHLEAFEFLLGCELDLRRLS